MFDFSDFCSFDFIYRHLARHLHDVHGFSSIEEAAIVSRDKDLLLAWKEKRGYISTPGQCGFCGQKDIYRTRLRTHLEKCAQNPDTDQPDNLPDDQPDLPDDQPDDLQDDFQDSSQENSAAPQPRSSKDLLDSSSEESSSHHSEPSDDGNIYYQPNKNPHTSIVPFGYSRI